MGQGASSHDPRHVRIWQNLDSLTADKARLQMLDALMVGPEYVTAARRAGIYADLLGWVAATRRGEYYKWPTPYAPASQRAAPPMLPPPQIPRGTPASFLPPPTLTREVGGSKPQLQISEFGMPAPAPFRPPTARPPAPSKLSAASNALATIPPPKRALDVLHESYFLLGIDDSKPLTHETLRSAYKRAAIKAHPDKGGKAEDFDAVNRAFLYLEEVLNKLLPKTAADGADPRFTMKVTPESALRARGDYVAGSTAAAPEGALRIEDAPQIALNPKKLDMTLFNKLFEENKLPDPDGDGYGDWLKSSTGRNDMAAGGVKNISKDTFNRVFEESARKATGGGAELGKFKAPEDLVLSPGFGTLIGADKAQFTKATGSMSDGRGLAYTDLMHAYGDGATFSQEVADTGMLGYAKEAALPGRARTMEDAEREYGTTPAAMSPEQAAAVAAIERARELAEAQRRQRVAARDIDAEAVHNRLKGRLLIKS